MRLFTLFSLCVIYILNLPLIAEFSSSIAFIHEFISSIVLVRNNFKYGLYEIVCVSVIAHNRFQIISMLSYICSVEDTNIIFNRFLDGKIRFRNLLKTTSVAQYQIESNILKRQYSQMYCASSVYWLLVVIFELQG